LQVGHFFIRHLGKGKGERGKAKAALELACSCLSFKL
jgi:hypothetical protein